MVKGSFILTENIEINRRHQLTQIWPIVSMHYPSDIIGQLNSIINYIKYKKEFIKVNKLLINYIVYNNAISILNNEITAIQLIQLTAKKNEMHKHFSSDECEILMHFHGLGYNELLELRTILIWWQNEKERMVSFYKDDVYSLQEEVAFRETNAIHLFIYPQEMLNIEIIARTPGLFDD